MGYPTAEAEVVKEAALFHDIGKCGIPPEILGKRGPLTSGEYEIVKTHAALGSERISEALRVLSAAEIVSKSHHERLNGSGYYGLAGGGIHPYARLVAVADVYDALITKRVYKRAWGENEVLEYFTSLSGIEFDPEIVSALFACTQEIAGLYK